MDGRLIAQLLYGILCTMGGILAWRTRDSYCFPFKVLGYAVNVVILLLGPAIVVLSILGIDTSPNP